MTPEEITAYSALIVTVITSLVVPAALRRKAARKAAGSDDLVSWQGITLVLQKERDELRKRLESVEADYGKRVTDLEVGYRKRVTDLEVEYRRQLDDASSRIKQLEGEVADLYRRLYRQPPPP